MISSSPVPQVKKIIRCGSGTNLGDRRHNSLEVVSANSGDHRANELFPESFVYTFFRAVSLVNKQVKQLVHLFIREPQFAFVRLSGPQIRGGGFVDDGLGDAVGTR